MDRRARIVVFLLLLVLGPAGAAMAVGNGDSLKVAALKKEAGEWLDRSDMKNVWKCLEEAAAVCRASGGEKAEARLWREAADEWGSTADVVRLTKIEAYARARKAYQDVHDTLDAALMLKNNADLHFRGNLLDLAWQELLVVLEEYKAIHFPKLYYTYDLFRAICKTKGEIAGEIFYTIRIIETMDSVPTSLRDRIYFNIRMAEAYRDAGMNERCLTYSREAYRLSQSGPNEMEPVIPITVYAFDLVQNDSPAKALIVLAPLYKGSYNQDMISRTQGDYILCLAYLAMNDLDRSERMGLRCVVRADSFYNRHSPVFTQHALFLFYTCLAETYIRQGQFRKAETFINGIPKDSKAPDYLIDRRRLALDRARIDSGLGQLDSALVHFQLYKLYSDSLYNIAKTVRLNEINTKYETERKDKDLRLLQQDNRLQHEQAQRSRFVRNTMIAAAVLLLAISTLLYNRYRIKQAHAAELQLQKERIADRNTALEKLLNENEWLLKEVHHRVKNNLQMVSSLLQSQSSFLTDANALAALADSQSRVQAMALIHQRLYNTADFSTIDMESYIHDLTHHLRDMAPTKPSIAFDVQVQPLVLDVNRAISVGLILNEVITNSIKYAFDDTPQPLIRVWLRQTPERRVELFAADNGKGLPPGMDTESGTSFGLRLIRGLAQELGADLSMGNDAGVEYRLLFPVHPVSDGRL